REIFVAVAMMVLAKLASGVTEWLEQFRNCRVFFLQSQCRGRQTNFGHATAQTRLAGNEGSPPSRATLLGVIVSEQHSFICDAVNIGRVVAHQASRVGADVGLANVVAPDNDYVGLLLLCCGRCASQRRSEER